MADNLKEHWLRYLLTIAVLVGIILAANRYLNSAEVLNALRTFDYRYAPFMLSLSAIYLALKAWRFLFLICPLTGAPKSPVFRGYVAGQAATLLPAGVAARAGLMLQLGIPLSTSSGPVLFSSLLDQAVFILSSLVAALWFPPARLPALILLGVVAFIFLILLVPMTRNFLVHFGDKIANRFHFRSQWDSFLETLPHFVTPHVMAITLAITIVAFPLKVITLDLTLRGLNYPLPYPVLFLDYILPTMFGRFLPIPGGVGVTEGGMVGFLQLLSSIDVNTAAAAVAIFRVATILWEALLGAFVYFFAWQGENEVRSVVPGD